MQGGMGVSEGREGRRKRSRSRIMLTRAKRWRPSRVRAGEEKRKTQIISEKRKRISTYVKREINDDELRKTE